MGSTGLDDLLPPRLVALRSRQQGRLSRADALAAGLSESEIDRLVRRGTWVVLRRGQYIDAHTFRSASAVERHAVSAAAAAAASAGSVVSHGSAATLLGIPLLAEPVRLHLTNPTGVRRSTAGLIVHGGPLDDADTVEVAGVRATSPLRTALDLARLDGLEPGVVALDHVLHQDPKALRSVPLAPLDRNGGGVALRALALADGRAESPGESLSRLVLCRLGLPTPELQYVVRDDSGRFVARTDFAWPLQRVLGEFDGRVKYASGDPEALIAEKARQDALLDLGWRVVRWGWEDLAAPSNRLASRLGPLLRRAA